MKIQAKLLLVLLFGASIAAADQPQVQPFEDEYQILYKTHPCRVLFFPPR